MNMIIKCKTYISSTSASQITMRIMDKCDKKKNYGEGSQISQVVNIPYQSITEATCFRLRKLSVISRSAPLKAYSPAICMVMQIPHEIPGTPPAPPLSIWSTFWTL